MAKNKNDAKLVDPEPSQEPQEDEEGCLQSLIDGPRKYADFIPIIRVLADRMRYSLFRRLRRYSSVIDIDIDVDDLSCNYLDVCAKDLDHDTLVYKINASVCEHPAITVFDNNFIDFVLNFILVSAGISGGRPKSKKSAPPPLTLIASELLAKIMEDIRRSMEDAFRAAVDVQLSFKRIFVPFPLNHDKHFMLKMKFNSGTVSLIMPLPMIEPVCHAFEANFGLPGDFESYSRALSRAVEVERSGKSSPADTDTMDIDRRLTPHSSREGVAAMRGSSVSDRYHRFIDDTEIELRVELGPKKVSVQYLSELKAGDVIIFNADKNVGLSTKNALVCAGQIGYVGSSLAVKIDEIINKKKHGSGPVE